MHTSRRLVVAAFVALTLAAVDAGAEQGLDYRVDLLVATSGFDGEMCWVHPRAGAVPGGAWGNDGPLVVMTMQKLLLSGSDLFYGLNQMTTADLGATWSGPAPLAGFERRNLAETREITVCDFTPAWHAASGKLLGTGHTVIYENNRIPRQRPRHTAYAVADRGVWSAWQTLEMPDDPKFANAGAGSVQRWDEADGSILLPIYFKAIDATQYATTVLRCRFDGRKLSYVGHGSELTVPVDRGLYEPSITKFGDRYYLTMRNDRAGYVSVSEDGQSFSEPIVWRFDDGSELGNYNTQQHWVRGPGSLFLVYTRRGAENDHVFRHRAPLFMAQVDPVKLAVIRATERVLVPNRGARLGNFAVTQVSDEETWVTVAEWMQPRGVEKHGSDNSVFAARIRWTKSD